nr:hypothetical protein CFP56_19372 [Quercus suber]
MLANPICDAAKRFWLHLQPKDVVRQRSGVVKLPDPRMNADIHPGQVFKERTTGMLLQLAHLRRVRSCYFITGRRRHGSTGANPDNCRSGQHKSFSRNVVNVLHRSLSKDDMPQIFENTSAGIIVEGGLHEPLVIELIFFQWPLQDLLTRYRKLRTARRGNNFGYVGVEEVLPCLRKSPFYRAVCGIRSSERLDLVRTTGGPDAAEIGIPIMLHEFDVQ